MNICKEHNKKFKGFSKYYLNNYCEDWDNYIDEFDDNDIIKFDDIKIEEKKIEILIKKINDNTDSTYENLSEKEEKRFKKLINIIINDFKNYPNFPHFFNIDIYYIFLILKMNHMKKT